MTRLEIAVAIYCVDGCVAVSDCFDAAERILAEESKRAAADTDMQEKVLKVLRANPDGLTKDEIVEAIERGAS